MKIAVLSPVAWRTPPHHYGPWEQMASNLTEGLVEKGHDVTLFATKDSITKGQLEAVIEKGYEEDDYADAKVNECLHISHLMENADQYDIIHNHYDFLPLTYSKLINTPIVTTIHGFSSEKILPVYKKYNDRCHYVSISNSDRSPELEYIATVYNGIKPEEFHLNTKPKDYLLYFGRIHQDKGTREAIDIALESGKKLIISGIIQDHDYFNQFVAPQIDNDQIIFVGSSKPLERNELMGEALALLHPINFKEPFGLSIVESMLCGTPVIAFNKGSMPEIIEDRKNGFLVKNIKEAAQSIAQIKDIDRSYCRESALKNFTHERMVNDYIQVYEQILKNK